MEAEAAKRVVAQGYDQIVDAHLERFGHSTVQARKFEELVQGLRAGAKMLDLGCGAGPPTAQGLVERGFEVTGVDASTGQIERARMLVPRATFIQSDMTAVRFPDESFTAVSAFYSISHVPREQHADLLKRIAGWLEPRGRFLASFGNAAGDWSGEWFGVPMFFSHHAPEVAAQLMVAAGFELERVEVLEQDNEAVQFLWLSGRKL